MDFNFLDLHHVRMKKIGAYALLFRNSISKGTWKKYGFEEGYEQDNMIFAVLLYIMEQSLKEEICTVDDIGGFIDEINSLYFKKPMTYEDSKSLGIFIINSILCDEGRAMYFNSFNFKEGEYNKINISFIKNKMEYVDGIRRVTYSLTEEGYSLLLSTLEVEEHLKFTIDEIIFKLHLEKADYNKAVDDIKNIFNQFRIRVQKIEDDIRRIKENPLSYSVDEYKKLTEGNLGLLESSKQKLVIHRTNVDEKISEFIHKDINIRELNKEEKENLNNLKIIKEYLSRTIDEDQRILKKHFDLKEVYGKELENISKMALIERFNFKNEVYDKIMKDLSKIGDIDIFLRPIFRNKPCKFYNINKAFLYKMNKKNDKEDDEELLTFDEIDFMEEEKKKKLKRLEKYKGVIQVILELAKERKSISLGDINQLINESEILMNKLIPSVQIFREVIIEMLKNRVIYIKEIRDEREDTIESGEIEFQLNKNILEILDENLALSNIKEIQIEKLDENEDIRLIGLMDDHGDIKNFICSDILFQVIE